MDIQIERLENHTARLTVTLTNEALEQAKKQAATKLSDRYKIPGFRKGKAPYNIVVKYLGEGAILEEAVEVLGNKIYPEALAQSQLRPFAPGSMDDFKIDPAPTYIFTVALYPEVALNDYRSVRLDYSNPEISEEDVDKTMESIRQQEAESVENTEGAEVGNRITVDLHTEFADGEEQPDTEDDTEDEGDEEETPTVYKGDEFIHRHDAAVILNPDEEPFLPGFIDAVKGKKAGEEAEFELTIPEDNEEYKTVAGRKVQFHVTIKKVENVTLPELNDEFAAKLTKDEPEPLTLEKLRNRVRENLVAEAVNKSNEAYTDAIVDKIIEGATLAYPNEMVQERINTMVGDFEERLKQQKITLELYKSVTGTGKEELEVIYRPDAEKWVKRSLVLGELVVAERLSFDNSEIDVQIDKMSEQFGEQAARFRQLFNTPQQRESIANNLLYTKLMERLAKIGKGEIGSEEAAS